MDETKRDKLRDQLHELHGLLDEAEGLDGETKQALKVVADDIQQVIEAPPQEGYLTQVREQWQKAAWDFESQHPRLAQTVDQITYLLANIGL